MIKNEGARQTVSLRILVALALLFASWPMKASVVPIFPQIPD
jgi:hypothetical protein